jgi:NitT/TauT family transport system permease protein
MSGKAPPLAQRAWFWPLVAPVLVGLLILAVWQAACFALDIPAYLFPAPSDIALALAHDAGTLLHALLATLAVTVLAFALAAITGTLVALLFVQSRIIEISLLPYAIMLQVTPIVAVAPLIIILVDDTFWSLVLCAAVVAVFPVISNTTIGLRSVDPGLLAYFRMNHATRWQTLTRLRLPSALPFFFAGLRIASGLSLIGAVVAEFVAGTGGKSAGLAYEILQSGFQLDIPRMFAALLLITLAGIALSLAMGAVSRIVLGRYDSLGEK